MTDSERNACDKLEDNNIRSLDLYAGEAVQGYLAGDISRAEMSSVLRERMKEMKEAVRGIQKLLTLSKKCPKQVVYDD